MGRRVSWVPALVVAAALLAGMSGCDTNPAPGPLTPGALPSDPAPSTGRLWQSTPPTAPAMPVAAQGTGPRAAKAFARYWIQALNYAVRTGETQPLRDISSPDCLACAAIETTVEKIYRRGGSMRGKGWEPAATRVVQRDEHAGTVVDVLVIVHPQVVFETVGSTPKRFRGGRRVKTLTMTVMNGRWQVIRLEQST